MVALAVQPDSPTSEHVGVLDLARKSIVVLAVQPDSPTSKRVGVLESMVVLAISPTSKHVGR